MRGRPRRVGAHRAMRTQRCRDARGDGCRAAYRRRPAAELSDLAPSSRGIGETRAAVAMSCSSAFTAKSRRRTCVRSARVPLAGNAVKASVEENEGSFFDGAGEATSSEIRTHP